MTPPPQIKRHEVFLIIALLFLILSYVIKGDWQILISALLGLGYVVAAALQTLKD